MNSNDDDDNDDNDGTMPLLCWTKNNHFHIFIFVFSYYIFILRYGFVLWNGNLRDESPNIVILLYREKKNDVTHSKH